jgi:LAO/AO transport system kinase
VSAARPSDRNSDLNTKLSELTNGIRSGDRRALARLMTLAERNSPGVGDALSALRDRLGRAQIVGITGPPGAGKSTLLLRLAEVCLASERSVGIVAVDPTSPLTGGSVLGDRIRLQALYSDQRVFIRSMSSGGAIGGLATRTLDMVDLLDAFGFDLVFVETVGVGQGETDISRVVDTNVVVLVPGLGDDIQALKAGLLETGDIFVVNKSDRPDAGATLATVRAMLELGESRPWPAPVLACSALKNEGVNAILAALSEHRQYLASSEEGRRRRRVRAGERIRLEALQRITAALSDELGSDHVSGMLQRGASPDLIVDAALIGVAERIRSDQDS